MKTLNPKKHKLGLSDSATGKTIATTKVVDLSGEFRNRQFKEDEVHFLFGEAQRGKIVQMEIGGMKIHFFVDELDAQLRVAARDDTFGRWAGWLGVSKPDLIAVIRSVAP